MSFNPDRIVRNATEGEGACTNCPAHNIHQGGHVNPGMLNPDADLMFLTMDPSHKIPWAQYADWEEYNENFSRRFASWRGGKKIQEMIEPLDLTLEDVWLGDSIKCPVDNALFRFDDPEQIELAFEHCRNYLVQEVATVHPRVIVGFGEDATRRVLELVFDLEIGSLKTGTADCGRVFEMDPPVIASPHWSHGWLDRAPTGQRNLEIVQNSLVDTYEAHE